MLPVEIIPVQETIVLRARGSELLILPHHVKKLKDMNKPKDFSQYFRAEALVNRPARKLFEAWLRKDHTLWPRLYQTVHKEMDLTGGAEGETPVAKTEKTVAKAEKPAAKAEKTVAKTDEKPAMKVEKAAAKPEKERAVAKAPAKDKEKAKPAAAAKAKPAAKDKDKEKPAAKTKVAAKAAPAKDKPKTAKKKG